MSMISRVVSYEDLNNIINIYPGRKLGPPLVYLATPYAKYPQGLDAAHETACIIAAKLFDLNINVFCPIAHNHHVAKLSGLATDFARWNAYNKFMLGRSDVLVVAMMAGWDKSEGIEGETGHAGLLLMPIYHLKM
jgi:hypothetical protein